MTNTLTDKEIRKVKEAEERDLLELWSALGVSRVRAENATRQVESYKRWFAQHGALLRPDGWNEMTFTEQLAWQPPEEWIERAGPDRFSQRRCVLYLIDIGWGIVDGTCIAQQRQNRKNRRQAERNTKGVKISMGGNPSRPRSTAESRRDNWSQPTEREQRIRRIIRRVFEAQDDYTEEDGEVAGLMRVIAEIASPQILRDFDLNADTHLVPFEEWLVYRLGLALQYPDPDGYLKWQGDS